MFESKPTAQEIFTALYGEQTQKLMTTAYKCGVLDVLHLMTGECREIINPYVEETQDSMSYFLGVERAQQLWLNRLHEEQIKRRPEDSPTFKVAH